MSRTIELSKYAKLLQEISQLPEIEEAQIIEPLTLYLEIE